jgi:hypothetical protein
LRELEFRRFRTPSAVPAVAGAAPAIALNAGSAIAIPGVGAATAAAVTGAVDMVGQDNGDDGNQVLEQGEVVTEKEMQIWFKGKRITDVKMELRALGRDYMVATSVRRRPIWGIGSGMEKEDTERDPDEDEDTDEVVFGAWEPVRLEDIHAIAKRNDAGDPS